MKRKSPKIKRPFGLPPMKFCDRLWSIIIRAPGKCDLAGKDHIECSGVLQGMHIEERTTYELRHKLWNGIPGCQRHHTYYTYRGRLWRELCERFYPGRLRLNEAVSRQVKLNYYEIAGELTAELLGLIRSGLLRHEYKGIDKKIVTNLTNGGQ